MAQGKPQPSSESECKISITFGNGVEENFAATSTTAHHIRSLILHKARIVEQVDRISSLPDEILVLILSLLNSREAITTSVLSRRWRYLSRYLHNLNLDGMSRLKNKHVFLEDLEKERLNYIRWIDEVISKNKSPTLEQFRLAFNPGCHDQQTIDRWVRFALSRRVEKLELDFTETGAYQRYPGSQYYYIFPRQHHHVCEFKFLKKLSTNHVSMKGEFVKELVRNCRHLQHLSISMSDISHVEIVEPSPSFKFLEITFCHNLVSLVIRDSNIVTLKVSTLKRISHVVLKNVPLLSELWCNPDAHCVIMEDIRRMFSTVLRQIRFFKLHIVFGDLKEEDTRRFSQTVELSNLKQLVVVGCAKPTGPIINLLNASPRLERFVLELPEQTKKHWAPSPHYRGRRDPKKYPHLKEMEIVGYHDVQFEMVMHLVENGAALRNIKVDPRVFRFDLDNWWELIPQPRSYREMAHRLTKYVPSTINLEVLQFVVQLVL